MSDSPYNEFGKNPRQPGGGTSNKKGMETDKLMAVQQKTAEVADQLRDNIDAVIQRGERIENLEEKSAELEAQSVTFAKKSHEVKRVMCWQVRMYDLFFVSCVVVAFSLFVDALCAMT